MFAAPFLFRTLTLSGDLDQDVQDYCHAKCMHSLQYHVTLQTNLCVIDIGERLGSLDRIIGSDHRIGSSDQGKKHKHNKN